MSRRLALAVGVALTAIAAVFVTLTASDGPSSPDTAHSPAASMSIKTGVEVRGTSVVAGPQVATVAIDREPWGDSSGTPGRSSRMAKSRPEPPRGADAEVRQVGVRGAPSVLRANADRLGLRVLHSIDSLGIVVVEPVDANDDAAALANRIERAGIAHSAQPAVPVYAAMRPDDTYFPSQWGYENTGQSGGTPGADSKATAAWDWSRGTGTVVAVTDTGIDFSHPELSGKAWVNEDEIPGNLTDDDGNGYVDDVNGYDFGRNDATVFDAVDGDRHGTHVAGTIGAETNNGLGVAGMGWDTKVMSAKFLTYGGGGSDLGGAAAITYAVDNGADVINASWGGTTYSSAIADAVAYAARHGVLVVCAAGNAGVNTDTSPNYPASLPATNVISVAALDRVDALASFSNRGATSVDLGAPGVSVKSTVPSLPGAVYFSNSTFRVGYLAFPLESVMSSTTRNQMMATAMGDIAPSTASPVLLVDDAWQSKSAAYDTVGWRRSAYQSMLAAAGYGNVTVWSTETSGVPSAAYMSGKTVVWFTGAATFGLSLWPSYSYGTLTTTERTEIQNFLAGGGRLLISSGDLGYEMAYLDSMMGGTTRRTWLATYFGARYQSDDPGTGASGLPEFGPDDGSLFAGLPVALIADPLRYSDGCDEISSVVASSAVLGSWPHNYVDMNGTSMAAPHVTGAVALMLSRVPTMTAEAAKTRILSTTDPVAALSGLCVTGGRLDAAEAVGTLPAPTGLRAWYSGPGTLQLSWNDPGEADFSATRLVARTDTLPTGPDDASATVVYEGTGEAASHTGLSVGTTVHYAAYARAGLGGWSEAARLTTTVAELAPGAPIPAGTNVSVTVDSVTLTFPSVEQAGWLSVTRIPARHDPPVGMRWVGSDYFEIHPEGILEMPVDIALDYDEAAVGGYESGLAFHHWTGSEWEDVTVRIDAAENVIHARTASFSDFGLDEPLGGPTVNASAEFGAGSAGAAGIGLAGLALMAIASHRRSRRRSA